MAKRTFWLVTGVALGAGSSLWAERRVRRTVQEAQARLQPDALVAEVGRSAKRAAGLAGERMRDAVTAGRSEMKDHEERLWDELAARGIEPPDGAVGELPTPADGGRGATAGPAADGSVPVDGRSATVDRSHGGRRSPVADPASPVAASTTTGRSGRARRRRNSTPSTRSVTAKSPSDLDR